MKSQIFTFDNALALLFFILPLYVVRFGVGPLSTTLLEIYILALTAVWVATGGLKELKAALHSRFLLGAITLFVCAAVIGTAISPDTRAAVGLFRAYWIEPLFVAAMVVTRVRTRDGLVRLLGALVLSGCSIAMVAIIQKFTGFGIPLPWDVERRATSIYPYPNAVGLYLAPIVPLALYCFRKHRPAAIASASLLIAAIFFARTDGAIVALAAVAIGAGLLWNERTRKVAIAVFLAGLLAYAVLPPQTQDSISRTLTLRDWSGKVRKSVWSESLAMLSDRPIFGAGIGGYKTALEPYHKATHLEIFLYPHNIFLNFWTETGLLGVISFFMLIGWFYYALLLRRSLGGGEWALATSMAIVLIHGLVDVPYFKNDLAVFFWFLIASAIVQSRVLKSIPAFKSEDEECEF